MVAEKIHASDDGEDSEREETAEQPTSRSDQEHTSPQDSHHTPNSEPEVEPGEEAIIRPDKSTNASNFRELVHNLRSPLTAILGMVELMKMLLEDEQINREEMEWYVNEIEQEALRMRDLLR
jgi:signal transduction histidine kinase